MNAAIETAPLTLAALAELFQSTVWQNKRVYVKGYATNVYLTIDSDGDVHASIETGRLSGKQWDAIFSAIERRICDAFGKRSLYT